MQDRFKYGISPLISQKEYGLLMNTTMKALLDIMSIEPRTNYNSDNVVTYNSNLSSINANPEENPTPHKNEILLTNNLDS
jgi:hypothetical protein